MKHPNTTAHSIAWKEFNSNSPQGRRLGAKQNFVLPYLILGKEQEKFEEGNLQNLQEINLLMGILVGYNQTPPAVDISYSKSFFHKALEGLKAHFKYNSIETMIIDIASYIRREVGDNISIVALLSGTEILPDSSPIKFDYCVDLYNLLDRRQYSNRSEGLLELQRNIEEIDPAKIQEDFIDHLSIFKTYLQMVSNI